MNVSKSIWHRRGEDVRRISADEISPGSHVSSERSGLPWLPIERVPKPMLCVPLLAHWMWLAMRYRSLTLPSAINPAIETGGLAGESKSAGLAQISETFASFVAPWRLVGPGEDPVAARRAAGFAYPLIAKPDIGWCGFGVRRIEDDGALSAYAAAFPPAASFIVQHLVTAPMEAGLFYLRQPASSRGRLLGITLRHAPHVTGDGVRTVSGLIYADPRTRRRSTDYIASLGMAALERIPATNECVVLTTVASLRVGARYEDASVQATAALEGAVDSLARSMPDFHLGRFDVRFECMAALRRGEFSVIEVNGAGSEAIHFWDPALSLRAAFAGVFAKQRLLFQLGAEMRDRGARPVGAIALSRAWLRQRRLIAGYPSSN